MGSTISYYATPIKYIKKIIKNEDDFQKILSSEKKFIKFMDVLSKGLPSYEKKLFLQIADNIKKHAPRLENFLILREFFPRSILKDACTFIAMDKPEAVIGVMKAKTASGLNLPYVGGSANPGGASAKVFNVNVGVPSSGFNLISAAGLSPSQYRLDLVTLQTFSGSAGSVNKPTPVSRAGSFRVDIDYGGGNIDTVSGFIDYNSGNISISSSNGLTNQVTAVLRIVLREDIENHILNNSFVKYLTEDEYVELNIDTIPLIAKTRKLKFEFSPEFMQDIKSLYNIDAVYEFVNLAARQIILDIESEIVNKGISLAQSNGFVTTFTKTPPSSFGGTISMWYQNLIVAIMDASAKIYSRLHYGAGNRVLMHPIDASILISATNAFRALFPNYLTKNQLAAHLKNMIDSGSDKTDVQPVSITFKNGLKVLVSPVVPQGNALVLHKNENPEKAVCIFGLYLTPVIAPMRGGNNFAFQFYMRYVHEIVRPQGLHLVKIV